MWQSIKQRFAKKGECQKVKEMLSPYLDQCLNPEEQRNVERHLASCQLCQEELASLRATVEWLHQAPVAAPRRSFAIAEARPVPRRRAFAALRVATAVAAVALAAIFSADLMHQFETSLPSQQPEENGLGQERDEAMYYALAVPEGEGFEDSQSDSEQDAESYVIQSPDTTVEANWVRPVEFSLLGATVILGGLTLTGWRRQRTQRR